MSDIKPDRRPASDAEIAVKRIARAVYNKRKPPKVTLPNVRSAHQGD